MVVKRVAAGVLAVGLAAGSVAGCASVERETGLGRGAQGGVLTGAAAGGVISALAGANPAWIAGSILLGGLVGGVVGNYLDERDKEQHAKSTYHAFQTQEPGGQSTWQNPDTGHSGATKIDKAYQTAEGTECKNFTQTINAGGETEQVQGTACRQPDGTWKVI